MTPKEHLEALQALCERLQPDLDWLINLDPEDVDQGEAVTLACKLYDAIKDPEECKP
jgi:hypothetical protein